MRLPKGLVPARRSSVEDSGERCCGSRLLRRVEEDVERTAGVTRGVDSISGRAGIPLERGEKRTIAGQIPGPGAAFDHRAHRDQLEARRAAFGVQLEDRADMAVPFVESGAVERGRGAIPPI